MNIINRMQRKNSFDIISKASKAQLSRASLPVVTQPVNQGVIPVTN